MKRLFRGDDGLNGLHVAGFTVALSGLGWYAAHLDTAPTGRTRYLSVSTAEMAKVGIEQTNALLDEYSQDNRLYSRDGPTYKQVKAISDNLIQALEFLPEVR